MYTSNLTTNKLKMIPCSKCGTAMPELRLTQYGYNFCVNCSSVDRKCGLPVQMGTGDHTWTETVIMDKKDYLKHTEQEELLLAEKKKDSAEVLDFDKEDKRNLQGPYQIINNMSNEE